MYRVLIIEDDPGIALAVGDRIVSLGIQARGVGCFRKV